MTKNIISLHGCTITQTSLPAAPLAATHERDASGNAIVHPAKNDGNSTIVTRDGSSETRGPFAFTGEAVACARAWNEEESNKQVEKALGVRVTFPGDRVEHDAGGQPRFIPIAVPEDDDISIE